MDKFLLAYMIFKRLPNFEDPYRNPLQNACCRSRNRLRFCKLLSKPEMMVKNSKIFEVGFGITF